MPSPPRGAGGIKKLDVQPIHEIANGGQGADHCYGGAGNDYIWDDESPFTALGAGGDLLWGGAGVDLIYVGWGAYSIRGNAGSDILQGDAGEDDISGGDGDDKIYGHFHLNTGLFIPESADDNAIDVLLGENGNDFVMGCGGADALFGGAGNDTLVGHYGYVPPDFRHLLTKRPRMRCMAVTAMT